MSNKANWHQSAKPEWWPDQIEFRSPNERKHGCPTMSVYEIDEVLSSCAQFVEAVSGVRNVEVDESAKGGFGNRIVSFYLIQTIIIDRPECSRQFDVCLHYNFVHFSSGRDRID